MKKILLSLILILTIAGTTTARAIDFDWGVTGGMNLTRLNMQGSNERLFGSQNRAGWFVGPKINLNSMIGLGFDAAVLYQQAQYNLTLDVVDKTILSATHKADFVSLPINARYNLGLGDKFSIYLATGPQFDFSWNDKEEDWFKDMTSTFRRENLAINWNVGVGVRIAKYLELGVTYNFGLSKAGERVDNWGNSIMNGLQGLTGKDDYRANAFKLHASVYF
jgi:opacity protein-like surface antigen